ncbi:MAG: class I SAM-dependent methyltransferase, partial [Myxococcales bacterium]|nr:class I SAM-dependent methyltransferase [Myxococcales bacterium]
MRATFSLLALLLAAPAAAQHPGPDDHKHEHKAHGEHGAKGHKHGDHATMHRRFDDVEWAKKHFEGPERAKWQKPRELVAALKIAPGATVADLGAGSGYFLPHLAEAVGPEGTVLALEVEPSLVAWLRERAEKEQLTQVVPVLSSFDRPRLPAEAVDLAIMVDVYHHIDGRKAWFAKALKTVRPGGRLVV